MNNLEKIACVFLCFLVSIFTYAQKVKTKPEVEPVKVPVVNNINSIDFSPTISADGRVLIFESDRLGNKWMLFQSTKGDDGEWSTPESIKSINEKFKFVAGPNLSHDGNTLYYTAFIEGLSKSEDIYYSVRTSEGWSAPIKFTDIVNTNDGYEGFSSISSDERDLYYISPNLDYPNDKKSNESCFNILVTRKNINGEWSSPELLPTVINSSCVRDPKIMADNRTLLFSKLTPGVKGKYDLYQSTLSADGNWGEPISLKYVNTKLSNLAPSIPASGDIMYFYSKGDIYTIEIPQEYRQFFNAIIYGNVSNYITSDGLPAKIIVKDANTLDTVSMLQANENGEFSVLLSGRKNYIVEFAADNFLSQTLEYDLRDMDKYFEEEKIVKLKPIVDLSIIVYDKTLKEPIPATITVLENGNEVSSIELEGNESSDSNLSLAINKKYTIVASSDTYKPDSMQVNTNDGKPLNLSFHLEQKRDQEVNFTTNNIYFKTNSSQLSAESIFELERVLGFLILNENISVKISAHADDEGSDSYNMKLSKARGKNVYDYLV
ncbi:MAG: OmpA family protein, partial [Cyclobacteriaceae bacterium]|nr:OmpA family protein [Cyclobacteriaceae bacterium]